MVSRNDQQVSILTGDASAFSVAQRIREFFRRKNALVNQRFVLFAGEGHPALSMVFINSGIVGMASAQVNWLAT